MDIDTHDDDLSLDATRGSSSVNATSNVSLPTHDGSFFSTFSDVDSIAGPRSSTPVQDAHVPPLEVAGMGTIYLDQSQSVVILDDVDVEDSVIFVGEYSTPPPSPMFDTIDLE